MRPIDAAEAGQAPRLLAGWRAAEAVLADGEWHHLAVVYQSNDADGSPRLRFFVDGRDEAIDPASIAGFPIETAVSGEHSGTMAIGRYELAARGRNPYLVAALDELRIFAGALSEEEIRSLAGER